MKAMSDLVERHPGPFDGPDAELTRLREQCEAKDAEIERLRLKLDQHLSANERLKEDRDEARALFERVKLEAQIHSGEARTHKSTVHECYQAASGATGEPGNWHGAQPVRDRITSLSAENERLRKALENWQEWWALPWQDKRPDVGVGSLNYMKGQKALSAHVGEGENDGE
jgi:chromosome segregation ATPase